MRNKNTYVFHYSLFYEFHVENAQKKDIVNITMRVVCTSYLNSIA